MKKFKIIAFMLALVMILSLASCKQDGNTDESSKPESSENSEEISSDVTEAEETTEGEKVNVLDLILRAEEIADGYTSGVQTSKITMKMGDTVASEEVSVTKKNGDDATYTVTSDGTVTESVVLDGGKILYYRDVYGAYMLSDATTDDFDWLISPDSGELDPFDFEDPENFTEGSAVKTDDGYDISIEFSEKGKARIIKTMEAPEGYTVKADKMLITGRIDNEGNMPEMRFEMVITMSMSGVSVTISAEAEMTFTEVGEDVKLDGTPAGVVYTQFGTAADFRTYLAASDNHAAAGDGESTISFEREVNMEIKMTGGSLQNSQLSMVIKGAIDPTKGASYSIEDKINQNTLSYYSNLVEVIVKENDKKIYVDPSIAHADIVAAIINDFKSTELGSLYCDKVNLNQSGAVSFRIEDSNAKAIVAAYMANNFSVDVKDVSIAGAEYIINYNQDHNYLSVAIRIQGGLSVGGQNCVFTIDDIVRSISYTEAEIVPLTPIN